MARYINADTLQAQLERKKAGIANRRYTEGWNDCMMRVKSMVSTAPTADVVDMVKYDMVLNYLWEWHGISIDEVWKAMSNQRMDGGNKQ